LDIVEDGVLAIKELESFKEAIATLTKWWFHITRPVKVRTKSIHLTYRTVQSLQPVLTTENRCTDLLKCANINGDSL